MKVQEGDKIEILDDGALGAAVERGDVLQVTGRISGAVFVTESPRRPLARGWWFSDSSEGEVWRRVESST